MFILLLIKYPLTKFMPQRIYVDALTRAQTFMMHKFKRLSLGCAKKRKKEKIVVQLKNTFFLFMAKTYECGFGTFTWKKTLKSFKILSRSPLTTHDRAVVCMRA